MRTLLRTILSFATAIGLFAGCSGRDRSEPSPDAGPGADAGGEGEDGGRGETRTISIRYGWNRHAESGVTFDPIDISDLEVQALVRADDGSWTTIEGEGRAEGTATIAGVPTGTVTVRIGSAYVVTESDSLELLFDEVGRDFQATFGEPTPVTFQVGGMSAWAATDMLQAFSMGAAIYVWELESLAGDTAPSPGDTSIDATIDWSEVGGEVDTSLGDVLTLYKLSTRLDGELQYRPLTDAFVPDEISLQLAQPTTVTGSFSPVEQHDLEMTWLRSDLEALRTAVHPEAGAGEHSLAVCALPDAHAYGWYGGGCPDLVILDSDPADATDAVYQVTYGDPFGGWDAFVSAAVYFPVSIIADGATQAETAYGTVGADLPLAVDAASVDVPVALSPVRSPTIDDRDAWQPQEGVGTAPTLRWEPSEIGEPTRYWVNVERVSADGASTVNETVASVSTKEPFVQLPPGVLVAGDTYFFYIGAASTDADLNAPYAATMPYAWATIVTDLVHP